MAEKLFRQTRPVAEWQKPENDFLLRFVALPPDCVTVARCEAQVRLIKQTRCAATWKTRIKSTGEKNMEKKNVFIFTLESKMHFKRNLREKLLSIWLSGQTSALKKHPTKNTHIPEPDSNNSTT